METWIYNGCAYHTESIGKYKYMDKTDAVIKLLTICMDNPECLVMHSKSKRLYIIRDFGFKGNGTVLKLKCEDIQTHKQYFFAAQNMEFVIKEN